ncbi:MAG: hypothetical protein PVG98_15585 [Chromatiales bacterium]|jgi:hemoglobin-like flavoprotein
MTPDSVEKVQRSFAHVLPHGDELTEAVFLRLAEAEPRLAPLFPAGSATDRRRFLIGLAFAVEGLDDVGQMTEGLRALGALCRCSGIGDDDLAAIRRALLDTMGQALGGRARGSLWTAQVRAAWAEATAVIVAAMRQPEAPRRAAA